jgi:hypothetical protein
VQARELLVAVLLDASRSALPSYSSLQAVTLLSGLTALGAQVEGTWLERFFEYSRTKVGACCRFYTLTIAADQGGWYCIYSAGAVRVPGFSRTLQPEAVPALRQSLQLVTAMPAIAVNASDTHLSYTKRHE